MLAIDTTSEIEIYIRYYKYMAKYYGNIYMYFGGFDTCVPHN